MAGKASWNILYAKLIVSDSVVERLVALCFLLTQASGKNVCGPVSARSPPFVDFVSNLSPQKSASVNNDRPNF